MVIPNFSCRCFEFLECVQWLNGVSDEDLFKMIFQTPLMAPKKRSHAESSSSQSTFDHNRFPSLGKATQFQEQYLSRSVESKREVAEELHDKLVFRSLAARN